MSSVEIPAYLIGIFLVEWSGRRPIINGGLIGAGVFCLIAGVLPQGLKRLFLISKIFKKVLKTGSESVTLGANVIHFLTLND